MMCGWRIRPGGVRQVAGDRETFRPGRLRRVRLLRLPFPLLLGLRLHLVCTLHGLPLGWALVGAKTDERDVQEDLLATTPALTRPKASAGPSSPTRPTTAASSKPASTTTASTCSDPPRWRETPSRSPIVQPLRQLIELVGDTLKANSTSNSPAAAPSPACASGSHDASSPSSPPSETTTKQAPPSSAHWSPTTTDPLELIIQPVTGVRGRRLTGASSSGGDR